MKAAVIIFGVIMFACCLVNSQPIGHGDNSLQDVPRLSDDEAIFEEAVYRSVLDRVRKALNGSPKIAPESWNIDSQNNGPVIAEAQPRISELVLKSLVG